MQPSLHSRALLSPFSSSSDALGNETFRFQCFEIDEKAFFYYFSFRFSKKKKDFQFQLDEFYHRNAGWLKMNLHSRSLSQLTNSKRNVYGFKSSLELD